MSYTEGDPRYRRQERRHEEEWETRKQQEMAGGIGVLLIGALLGYFASEMMRNRPERTRVVYRDRERAADDISQAIREEASKVGESTTAGAP